MKSFSSRSRESWSKSNKVSRSLYDVSRLRVRKIHKACTSVHRFHLSIQSNVGGRTDFGSVTHLWLDQRHVKLAPNRDASKQGTSPFKQTKKLVCFRSDSVDVWVQRERTNYDDAKIFFFGKACQGCVNKGLVDKSNRSLFPSHS